MKLSDPSNIILLLSSSPSLLLVAGNDARTENICTSPNNVFTVRVNLLASELGYFWFEECGDMTNPTIGMEFGETYTFVQSDVSNYYHPMGFAYFPDGAHDDVDELEPGIAQGRFTRCSNSMSCPAPMYFLNDDYLGTYSNIRDVLGFTSGEDNFGLDDYEPLFFLPLLEWQGLGEFSIRLRFDDAGYTDDIFYFCHIHQFMSGRIKILNNGVPVQPDEVPPLGYEYEVPSSFDERCGTSGLDDFQLPHRECPERFVCDAGGATQPFAECIDAMNCHMIAGMTTQDSTRSRRALFLHQMIPHHQNAVNMAKALMNTGDIDCDDITDEDDPNCVLAVLSREIINNQNFQIQTMRGLLDGENWPSSDDCNVNLNLNNIFVQQGGSSSDASIPSSDIQYVYGNGASSSWVPPVVSTRSIPSTSSGDAAAAGSSSAAAMMSSSAIAPLSSSAVVASSSADALPSSYAPPGSSSADAAPAGSSSDVAAAAGSSSADAAAAGSSSDAGASGDASSGISRNDRTCGSVQTFMAISFVSVTIVGWFF